MASKREKKRDIVRWNEMLDKTALLAIQAACNEAGIQLPWHRVAEMLGRNITQGAIIQHLAKIRSRMVAEGLEVPPPLRRGGKTYLPSPASPLPVSNKAHAKVLKKSIANKRKRTDHDDSDSEDEGARQKKPKSQSARACRQRTIKEEDSEEEYRDQTTTPIQNSYARKTVPSSHASTSSSHHGSATPQASSNDERLQQPPSHLQAKVARASRFLELSEPEDDRPNDKMGQCFSALDDGLSKVFSIYYRGKMELERWFMGRVPVDIAHGEAYLDIENGEAPVHIEHAHNSDGDDVSITQKRTVATDGVAENSQYPSTHQGSQYIRPYRFQHPRTYGTYVRSQQHPTFGIEQQNPKWKKISQDPKPPHYLSTTQVKPAQDPDMYAIQVIEGVNDYMGKAYPTAHNVLYGTYGSVPPTPVLLPQAYSSSDISVMDPLDPTTFHTTNEYVFSADGHKMH